MSNTAVSRARRSAAAAARRRSSRGAVAVEFALILPILVMLLLGTRDDRPGVLRPPVDQQRHPRRRPLRFRRRLQHQPDPMGRLGPERVQQVYFNSGSTLSSARSASLFEERATRARRSPRRPRRDLRHGRPRQSDGHAHESCYVKVWVRKPASIDLGVVSASRPSTSPPVGLVLPADGDRVVHRQLNLRVRRARRGVTNGRDRDHHGRLADGIDDRLSDGDGLRAGPGGPAGQQVGSRLRGRWPA